jgi:hypothetical protein
MTDVMTEPLPYSFGKPNGNGWIDGTALADPEKQLISAVIATNWHGHQHQQ